MKTKDPSKKVIHLNERKPKGGHGTAGGNEEGALRQPRIIAITSGKGGVGKTNIVANLGYALCRFGKRVLILDADLGLGNLDVLLGLAPQFNLSHVIRREKNLQQIVLDGPGRLKILPAASGIHEITALTEEERGRVFGQLVDFMMDYDVILIDTAAGISANVLYFNTNADDILVVATPEPTSMTDAYALMKVLSVKYGTAHFKLVVNSVVSEQEADDVYRQLSLVADRFLNISLEYFGCIPMDENVKKGVRKQQVVSEMAPLSKAGRSFAALARKVANSPAPSDGRSSANWGRTDI